MNRREQKIFYRVLAIGLSKDKLSVPDICHLLPAAPNPSTVHRWIHSYNNAHQMAPIKQTGKPPATTVRSNRYLCRLALNHHLSSARELRQYWREQVSIRTIYRRLRNCGIRKRRRAICPLLSRVNIAVRMQWSMAHSAWRDAVWSRVVFSDETRFRRMGNDGRIMVWRRAGERFKSRNVAFKLQCGGGSVHVWGAIWKGGRSEIVVLRRAVNQHTYIETLQGFFQQENLPRNFIFQDDNAPAHRAAAVSDFHEATGVRRLPWPSRSPDLNPIEHVWDSITRRINSRPNIAESLHQLEVWVREEWRQLPQPDIDALIDSMPRRVRAVIIARGGSTQY